MSNMVILSFYPTMRTAITIDDKLLNEAERITGLKDRETLVCEAFKALIERESARRLTALGGTEPDISFVTRHRSSFE